MYQSIYNLLESTGLRIPIGPIAYLAALVIVALVSYAARMIARGVLVRLSRRLTERGKHVWGATLYRNKMFQRMSNIAVPIALSLFAEGLPQYNGLVGKIAGVTGVAAFLLLFNSLLKSIDEVYRHNEASKTLPLKSLLQVIEVIVIIVGSLAGVAILTGVNVSVILGGIGAATAVISLIFKDSILGFVAGIQLIANDMIRIGDWIEMPGQSADGTVIDLTMTTVKVENFNKTITSIPVYTMVSNAFINWRGMETSGGRRIKRALFIDASDIRLCDDEMIERLRGIELLREYIDDKISEVTVFNKRHSADLSHPVNGRRLTNIGTFRAYIAAYLKQHPGIHREMTCMVRQLTPDDRGVPLEIYAFANTVQWADYEAIQSDIFDHLYAVVSQFGLRVYQKPSSGDIRAIGGREPHIIQE